MQNFCTNQSQLGEVHNVFLVHAQFDRGSCEEEDDCRFSRVQKDKI